MGYATLGQDVAGWSRSTPLLAGDAGTEQTIELIRQAVWEGLRDERVRAQLAEILRGIPAYNSHAEVEAIYNWVLRHIRFTNDPVGHETVSSANWILTHRIGDCDDINAVLLPTLVMMAGIPVHVVTVSNDPSDPTRFSHIYSEAELGGQVIPLDAARPGARFGQTVSQYARKRLWSLVSQEYQDLRGLGGVYLRGMGFDWGIFTDVITNISNSVSQVLSSITQPTPYTGTSQPPPGGTTGTSSGMSGNTMLILGGLGIAAFALSRK